MDLRYLVFLIPPIDSRRLNEALMIWQEAKIQGGKKVMVSIGTQYYYLDTYVDNFLSI